MIIAMKWKRRHGQAGQPRPALRSVELIAALRFKMLLSRTLRRFKASLIEFSARSICGSYSTHNLILARCFTQFLNLFLAHHMAAVETENES